MVAMVRARFHWLLLSNRDWLAVNGLNVSETFVSPEIILKDWIDNKFGIEIAYAEPKRNVSLNWRAPAKIEILSC
jgi:hypothetical protein